MAKKDKWLALGDGAKRITAKDNLGVAALKFGPLYIDCDPKEERFFMAIDIFGLTGIKVYFNFEGWKLMVPSGTTYRGDWS